MRLLLILFMIGVWGCAGEQPKSMENTEAVAEKKTTRPNFKLPPPPAILAGQPTDVTDNLKWQLLGTNQPDLIVSQVKDSFLVINLWATWCPPCIAEMPAFMEFVKAMSDYPVKFLFISNEDEPTITPFLEANRFDIPSYRVEGEYPPLFQVAGLPATFIINPKGELLSKHLGAAEWSNTEFIESFQMLVSEY